MRVFIAVPVSGAAALVLDGVVDDLAGHDWPVRWARPGQWHLTLKFLGETGSIPIPDIAAAVGDSVKGTGEIPISLSEAGVFPPQGPERVLWVGLNAPPSLELMQNRLERACLELGFPTDGRPFRPHLTLGRVRRNGRLPEGAVNLVSIPPGAFTVADRVILFESIPAPGGAHHHPRFTQVLAA
ncbi:MAG: RNA 2',3'-cyclic phosphodiesterase [Gemmatimonadales bacterium]